MPRQRSDPEVTKWMKEHSEEVGKVEKLYSALREMELQRLAQLATDVGVDLERHWDRFRSSLITDIVKTAPEKALEVVLGQGVLVGVSEAQTK